MNRARDLLLAHPRLAALLLGLVSAFGFQPLGLWPLTIAAVAALIRVIADAQTARGAALRGWLFGVAHFTAVDNWIATAFTYQAEMPAALGYAAVPLLSLYLAVYIALAAFLATIVARRIGGGSLVVLVFAFAASWILGEWLRSWVFTGYAWGPLGQVLLGPWDRPGLASALPWLGSYALSGVAVLIAGALLAAIDAGRWKSFAVACAVLGILMYLPAGKGREGDVPLTLVQPDVRQEVLDDPTQFENQFLTLARLSAPRRQEENRLVLWPESGVPDYLRPDYPQRYYSQMTAGGDPDFARFRIGRTIGDGSLLLTGAVDLELGNVDGQRRAVGAYNSVTPIYADGRLGERYAKAHLVPYGEYLPLREILLPLGLTRLVAGSIDFIPGPGPQTFDFGAWGKAGMQICYEIVFSGEVVERGNRPDYIFNPSNDGWFGSWGPPQHLAQARMRAMEEGLPVLRATTTGISAVIDARGIVRDHIGMHREGRIDMAIPPPHDPTPFGRLGHWLTLIWGAVFLLASLVASRLRKR